MLLRDRPLLILLFSAPRFWLRALFRALRDALLFKRPKIVAASVDVAPALDGGWVHVRWECTGATLVEVEGLAVFFPASGETLMAANQQQRRVTITAHGFFSKVSEQLSVHYFDFVQPNMEPSAKAMATLGVHPPTAVEVPAWTPKRPVPQVAIPHFSNRLKTQIRIPYPNPDQSE